MVNGSCSQTERIIASRRFSDRGDRAGDTAEQDEHTHSQQSDEQDVDDMLDYSADTPNEFNHIVP